MTDFARGGLLARLSLAGGEGAQQLYEAKLDTELTLVMVSVQADAQFSLFHDDAISPVSATYDFSTSLLYNYPLNQAFHGVVLAAQALGCAIHVKQGQFLGASCDVAATVTLYGVTAALGQIR